MRRLLFLLPLVLGACSTAEKMPTGKSIPINSTQEVERLLYYRNGLMLVGPKRHKPETKERLLKRPKSADEQVTVPGGQLLDRTITATFDGGRWNLKLDKEQKFNFMLLMAAATDVEVTGYTDARYNNAKNEAMARRRAESGVNYLIDRGFPQERISSSYMASGGHVADNTTKAGRAKNRRVEFKFSVDSWEN